MLPQFMDEVTNFTAAVGKTAALSCRVQNLTQHKVSVTCCDPSCDSLCSDVIPV